MANENTPRVIPHFFTEEVVDIAQSEKEGRPIYQTVERVMYMIPGDKNSRPVFKVSPAIRERFKSEYKAFQEGREQRQVGTPLGNWGQLTPARIKELEALEINTVDDLARVSDGTLQNLGAGALELRSRARAYLDATKNRKAAEDYAARASRAENENARLSENVAVLKQELDLAKLQIATLQRNPDAAKMLEDIRRDLAKEGELTPTPDDGDDEKTPEPKAAAVPESKIPDDLNSYTKPKLEAFAAENGVDISNAKNNPERIALIRKALSG